MHLQKHRPQLHAPRRVHVGDVPAAEARHPQDVPRLQITEADGVFWSAYSAADTSDNCELVPVSLRWRSHGRTPSFRKARGRENSRHKKDT